MTTRLAVLGSPIAHSKSPALHRAAYGALGLDWQYDAIELTGADLPQFIANCGPDWRGLSLTMPLKKDVLPLLDTSEQLVEVSGAANTVLFDEGSRGFNTDVAGIVAALRSRIALRNNAVIIGGGATAGSALLAADELGFANVRILVRSMGKTGDLARIAESVLANVVFGELDAGIGAPDLVISTVPGHANLDLPIAIAARRNAILFDVAYDPWPSALATQWLEAGGTVVSGLEMLAAQALSQVRIFVNGDADAMLPNEDDVWAAMRASVGLPASNGQ
jgi:shikimate dehydrogenase